MYQRVAAALAAGALAIPLITGLAASASAGTTTSGVLTITAADREMQPGCYDYQNMTYTVTDGVSWSLDVDVYRETAVGGSDFAYGDGFGSGLLSAYLCDNLDGPGTYTVRAVLTSDDVNNQPLPNVEAYTTFVLSAPYVAPPVVAPPVAKVATRTGIVVASANGNAIKTLRRGKTALVAVMLLRGTSGLNGARVTLQSHRVGHPWANTTTRTTTTMAGHKGMAVVKAKPLRTTFYRWIFSGTTTSTASTSSAKKLTVRN